MMLAHGFKSLIFLLLCLLLLFFSCTLPPPDRDDKDDNGDTDTRILPEDIEQILESFTEDAPLITRLRVVGQSSGTPSYPMYALKLTDNPEDDENEPEIQMVGAIHGNEQLSCMILIKLIDYMITHYETDPEITDIINNYEIHFFPVMNPYGLSQNERFNANHVDLNRNFGWAWVNQPDHGNSAFDQPESQAIRDDAYEHPYVLSILGHTGAACINTLWDYIGTTQSSGDPQYYTENDFVSNYLPAYPFITGIATTYLNTVIDAGDDTFWMTEGYEWYPVFGSIQDWLYGERGTMAFTLEYHPSFNHLESNEPLFGEIFGYHRDALINFIQYAQRGISGIITGNGGLPVNARIEAAIAGKRAYDDPVSYTPFSFTDPDFGDYHLPLQPGTYNLTIVADGYLTHSIDTVVVPPDSPWAVVQDIELVPGKSVKTTPNKPVEPDPELIPPDLREE